MICDQRRGDPCGKSDRRTDEVNANASALTDAADAPAVVAEPRI
jgi:hypothetical protein